jgi:hypothetical protein
MTNRSPLETHEGKQRNYFALVLYVLTALGIAMYIAFADIWPITFFQDLLADSKNMYPVKAVFMLTFLSVLAVLYPLYWIVKQVIRRKNNAEIADMPLESISSGGAANTGKKEFSFEYYSAVSSVSIDNMFIQMKMGFAKRNFPVSALRNFYLVSKNQYQTFYVTYTDESGKLKKCPMNAQAGDAQLAALVSEMTARFPEKSLNHLSQKEAFRVMNVTNPALLAVIILVAITGIIGAIVFFSMK